MRMKTRTLTQFALLSAIALVLGWVERMIPISGIPGVKLGLGNLVLLYALYLMDRKSAALLMLIKVFLSGFLFGSSLWTILISLGGGACSLLAMILLKCIPRLDIVFVSVGGAIFHILGQLLVIILAQMAPWSFILFYMPILGAASILTGILTGIVAKYALKAMHAYPARENKPAEKAPATPDSEEE